MLAGVSEAEPDRIWFGNGGCVEEHDDGTFAVFVRGELVGVFGAEDVASRDVLIAVVLQHEQRIREEVARAFRVSPATVGRAVTHFKSGGFRAVADYGRVAGRCAHRNSIGGWGSCSPRDWGLAAPIVRRHWRSLLVR